MLRAIKVACIMYNARGIRESETMTGKAWDDSGQILILFYLKDYRSGETTL